MGDIERAGGSFERERIFAAWAVAARQGDERAHLTRAPADAAGERERLFAVTQAGGGVDQ